MGLTARCVTAGACAVAGLHEGGRDGRGGLGLLADDGFGLLAHADRRLLHAVVVVDRGAVDRGCGLHIAPQLLHLVGGLLVEETFLAGREVDAFLIGDGVGLDLLGFGGVVMHGHVAQIDACGGLETFDQLGGQAFGCFGLGLGGAAFQLEAGGGTLLPAFGLGGGGGIQQGRILGRRRRAFGFWQMGHNNWL